jgi:hypothetical protein
MVPMLVLGLALGLVVAAPLSAQSVTWLPRGHAFEVPIADPLGARFAGVVGMSDIFTRPLIGNSPGAVRDANREDPEPQAVAVLGGIMPIVAAETQGGCRFTGSVEAVVLARFRLRNTEALSNDWWAAVPLAASCGRASAQFRIFHRSDHLNDEFLLRHEMVRRGPVQDGVDATLSWRHSPGLRVYGGVGQVLRHYWGPHGSIVHGGLELSREARPGIRFFAAAHLRAAEASEWGLQRAFAGGVEYRGGDGAMRLSVRDLRGPSTLGEFFRNSETMRALEITVIPGGSFR